MSASLEIGMLQSAEIRIWSHFSTKSLHFVCTKSMVNKETEQVILARLSPQRDPQTSLCHAAPTPIYRLTEFKVNAKAVASTQTQVSLKTTRSVSIIFNL